ncbi:MAG: radical SAM protein [Clostridiales bacterium]|nr:radical SAM protein [Clostridiales bacterium]
MKNNNEVKLIFPPHWCPTHPYLSLPCLKGYLEEHGIQCSMKDLSLECNNFMLSNNYLSQLLMENSNRFNEKEKKLYSNMINEIDDIIIKMSNDDNFYNSTFYNYAKNIIDLAYSFISICHEKLTIERNNLRYDIDMRFSEIDEIVNNTEENLYYKIYEDILDTDELLNCKVIGISLVSEEQLIPSLILCKYIRSINDSIHIFIGGSYLSKMINDENLILPLYNYFDTIIIDEGEKAVLNLISGLINNISSASSLKNIIDKENYQKKEYMLSSDFHCSMENLPIPVFDDYSSLNYWSPKKILPYFISRKCYWNKCSFCQHDSGYANGTTFKSYEKIKSEITTYILEYKTEVIHFIDSAIPPKYISSICDILLEENYNITWYCYVRAEKGFTLDLAKKMKEAGCVKVYIGVESFSDETLISMQKGVSSKDIKNALLNFDCAGIWTHSFMIHGFPTERSEDQIKNLIMINSIKNSLHSISVGNFLLMRNTSVLYNRSEFNISGIVESDKYSSHFDFERYDHVNFEDAQVYQKLYNSLVPSTRLLNNTMMHRDHLPILLSKIPFVLEKNKIQDFINSVDSTNQLYSINQYILIKEDKEKAAILNCFLKSSVTITHGCLNFLNSNIGKLITKEMFFYSKNMINQELMQKEKEWEKIVVNKVIICHNDLSLTYND